MGLAGGVVVVLDVVGVTGTKVVDGGVVVVVDGGVVVVTAGVEIVGDRGMLGVVVPIATHLSLLPIFRH